MIKKQLFSMTAILLFVLLFNISQVFALDETIFIKEIESAVDQTIEAWKRDDRKSLEKALNKLSLNEAYLLAVGKFSRKNSYLALVPKGLNDNPFIIAGYLFFIRQKRTGVNIFPKAFFEGQSFNFTTMEQRK